MLKNGEHPLSTTGSPSKIKSHLERKSTRKSTRARFPQISEDGLNIGVWTKDEHKKIIEALRKFGNDWQIIQEFVGTRSSIQVRSHCQKYFKAMKNKEYKELKKTNMLGKRLFIVTREYRNVSHVAQKHPYELLIDVPFKPTKAKSKDQKIEDKSETLVEVNQAPSEGNLNMQSPPEVVMITPTLQPRIAESEMKEQPASIDFDDHVPFLPDITLPEVQLVSPIDNMGLVDQPSEDVEEPPNRVFLSSVIYDE